MNTKPPLLLFRIYEISDDAFWGTRKVHPLPDGWSAMAVSGGMEDLAERRRGKRDPVPGYDFDVIWDPFLSSAPTWIASRVVWALLGSGGRFYPIYRSDPGSLLYYGIELSALPDTRGDILASLKFDSLSASLGIDWSACFCTCFSDAIGLGFWGEENELERKLKCSDDLCPLKKESESRYERVDQAIERVHPYLHACWHEYGFGWLLDNAQIVARPQGYEGKDILLLSAGMSYEEMVRAVRRDLGTELDIVEYIGPDDYRRWKKWDFNVGDIKDWV